MANTYVDYTATAAQTDFAFSFPYLEDSHVVVEIDSVVKTITTHYTIVTSPSKKIVLTSGATAGQIVRVRRDSNADGSNPFVDFTNGSVLTEDELDKSYLHNLYLNEEIGELNQASLQKQAGGTEWDAKNLRILNVADPTGLQDAATKTYTDGQISANVHGLGAAPVKQTFTGDGSETEFTFSSDITLGDDTAYEVAIDGVLQEPTTAYAINATTNKITFTSPPPNTSKVVIIPRGHTQPIGAGSTVAGNVAVTGNVTATGNVTSVDVTASGDVSVGDDLTVTDDASVGGNLAVTGNTTSVDVTASGDISVGDDLTVTDDASVGGNLAVTGNTTSVDVTASGDVSVGDDLTVTDDASVGGDLAVTGKLTTTGNIGIGTASPTVPLDVTGNAAVSGTLTVGGLAGVTLLGKYSTGWVNSVGGTTVANGATLVVTHNLGTTDVAVEGYVSANSDGSSPFSLGEQAESNSGEFRGAQVTAMTTNTVTFQLGGTGYIEFNSTGQASFAQAFTSKYVKIVVIG